MVSKSHRLFPNLQHELFKLSIVIGGLLLPSHPVLPPWRHLHQPRAFLWTIASNMSSILAGVACNTGYESRRHRAEVVPVTSLATVVADLALVIAECPIHDGQLAKLVTLALVLVLGGGGGSLDHLVNELVGVVDFSCVSALIRQWSGSCWSSVVASLGFLRVRECVALPSLTEPLPRMAMWAPD